MPKETCRRDVEYDTKLCFVNELLFNSGILFLSVLLAVSYNQPGVFEGCVFICLKVITRKYILNNANLITEVNLLPYYECAYKVNSIKGHSHEELAHKTKISSHNCASMKSSYSFTVAFERRDKMKLRFASQSSSVFHNLLFLISSFYCQRPI